MKTMLDLLLYLNNGNQYVHSVYILWFMESTCSVLCIHLLLLTVT